MKIGVPKEIKNKENRVAMTPAAARSLIQDGHRVLVEVDAGLGSGFSNTEYEQAGAQIVSAAAAWDVELVVKVKEPLPSEYPYLDRQMLFTFLHLAGVTPDLTVELLKKGTTAIAYETLEDEQGRLPILAPMSAVAGNMATVMGSYYLATFNKGRGVQLGEVMGRKNGNVVIIGYGMVGQHAAAVASGMGANVKIALDEPALKQKVNVASLTDEDFFVSHKDNISPHLVDADLVIGAVLQRGAKAPKIISEEMIKSMPKGAVVVDVSIDQGGCIETSRPTTHSDPVFIKHDVVHYCVANMPGAYPRTSTIALVHATLPYIGRIANAGKEAVVRDKMLIKAVNVFDGKITYKPVAEALGMLSQYQSLN